MQNHLTEFESRLIENLGAPELGVLSVKEGGEGIALERTADGWNITLKKSTMLGRAVMLMEENSKKPEGWKIAEKPVYDRLGIMLDCARVGVPKPETVERMLCILSRMGYSTMQLYMEDVFELDGYPYFGHGRGRYTKEDLKRMDRFAASVGIELIPAIQTLAHLGQALKWRSMQPLVDTADILLIDDPETYRLVDAMFAAAEECFTSKRINIGMDEAHMVGLGRYLDQHGYENRAELMMRHFTKVHELAAEHGLEPMMWSDMFFRLATGGEYYAPDCKIDPAVKQNIPADTTLVYWDYYSEDETIYDRMMERHKELCPNLIFAGGAWRWSGAAPANSYSMKIADLAHSACRKNKVPEVLITMWGDNGAECSPFAVLPSLQYWAELCWHDGSARDVLASRFALCTKGDFDDFMQTEQLIFTPDNPAPGRCGVNATRSYLYEDPLIPLFTPGWDMPAYAAHLETCVKNLDAAGENEPEWQPMFTLYRALARLLLEKTRLQCVLRPAWKEKDRAALERVCSENLPGTEKALDAYIDAYHRLWLCENRAAGLEIFDIKAGALMQRMKTARMRLEDYLAGNIETVEELDLEWLPFDEEQWKQGHGDIGAPLWHQVISPTNIAAV